MMINFPPPYALAASASTDKDTYRSVVGDGITVGSGVAAALGVVVGGTVAETVALAAGAGRTGVTVAA